MMAVLQDENEWLVHAQLAVKPGQSQLHPDNGGDTQENCVTLQHCPAGPAAEHHAEAVNDPVADAESAQKFDGGETATEGGPAPAGAVAASGDAAVVADDTNDRAGAPAGSITIVAVSRPAADLQVVDDPVSRENALDQLAEEVRQHHSSFISSIRTSFEHARAAGCVLVRVKDMLAHGEWTAWVETHCNFSLRTAQKYMGIAASWGKLPPNAPSTARFTIDGLLATAGRKKASPNADADARGADAPDTDGRDGYDDDEASTAPPQAPSYADQLKKHEERCRRLRALSRTHLSREDEIVRTNADAGIEELAKEVVTVIRKHAASQCTRAVKKCGGDVALMAMVLTAQLRDRLDPTEIFAPKHPLPAERDAAGIAS